MGLMFEVAEGGFLDIDVKIEGPDGKIVHQVRTLNFYFKIKQQHGGYLNNGLKQYTQPLIYNFSWPTKKCSILIWPTHKRVNGC